MIKMMAVSLIAAVTAGMLTATPAMAIEPVLDKVRTAKLDDCRYQSLFLPDSRYNFHAEATFRGWFGIPFTREVGSEFGSTELLLGPGNKRESYRHVLQFDVCSVEEKDSLISMKIVGKLHNPDGYQPEVPRVITSSDLKPEDRSLVPATPTITKAQLIEDKKVAIEWSPSQKIDQYILVEAGPFYQSEVGWWITHQEPHVIDSKKTSVVRNLRDFSGAPKEKWAHTYWVRAVANGFFNDLRDEKKLSVHPSSSTS